MRLNRNIGPLLIFLQLIGTALQAQISQVDEAPQPAVYGEIDGSLFSAGADHDYPFEYLLRQTTIRFEEATGGVWARLEHHHRIRVLSDDPVDVTEASLVGVPYYFAEQMEQIVELEGATYHPDGTVSELDTEQVRRADINSRYRVMEFMMPDVEKGSVLEYRYVVNRRYIDELPDIYFSHRVPTRKAHLILHNEDYLRYDAVGANLDFEIRYHEERIDTSDVPRVFTYRRPDPLSVEHWYAEQVPAVEQEVYISSMQDLRGVIKLQISEVGNPRQPLENSWDYIAAQIRRGELNPYSRLPELEAEAELGAALTADAASETESLQLLFRHINRRMTFNGVYRPFPVTPPGVVLDAEPSDQAAVNMALLALLRGAGLEAWPVYLSGRDTGRIERDFPSIYQFTQMLVLARADGREYWMDASFSNSRPGMISADSWNRSGMVFRPDSFSWEVLRPEYSLFDLDVSLRAELTDRGDLRGEMDVFSEGYPAREIRESLSGEASVSGVIREAFFDSYGSITISEASITESGTEGYALRIYAAFEIPGYALSFREGLQFAPMVVGYMQQNPFDESERRAPVTLDAPERVEVRYEISLPQDYRTDQSRESVRTDLPGAGLYEEYESFDRTLRYTFRVEIDRRDFSIEEYSELRRLYNRWVLLSGTEWFIRQEGGDR